ncbi:PREDICTED: uncharacterized protein DDB_G0272718 [Drosophila arizonae]|uniref:Uncharacterized protein DDB_G0272718 n=1 Tax=Drosophila arizonae TaxID=7263 RepID=A0ABM1P0W3_DROAR|nr:PREDICTED: uncharacterized protein DDB_G0272718 [Drosophila arizonae]
MQDAKCIKATAWCHGGISCTLQAIEHPTQRQKRITNTNNMLKLLISMLALCALAAARPGYLHGHHHHYPEYPLYPAHHHIEPLHVAKIVHVPAAVSHQSSTVVHSVPHHIIKPVVLPTVVKTVVHPPIIKTYHPAPIIKAYPYDPYHFHHHHGFHDYHLH